ncbi:MAG: tetratricopeptide repeat protein [Pseudomonadota bacterium]
MTARAWLAATVLLAFSSIAAAQSVSRSTFSELEDIQALVEADRPAEAQARLKVLVAETANLPYDNAIANQYLAHTSVMLDQSDIARAALERALAAPELPPDLVSELKMFYGTVLLGQQEFELARSVLNEWLAGVDSVKSSQLFSVAYANYQAGDLARAEPLLLRAIEQNRNPPLSWFQVYYQVLFDQKKFELAGEVLHEALTRGPNDRLLWRMLANHHIALEESRDALAVLMVAYINELANEPDELRQLVSMFGYVDIPEKGARLLQRWLDGGVLERDKETLLQLGNLWLLARERTNAKAVLRDATAISPDSGTFELLAGIHFEDEEWSQAHTAFQAALNAGGVQEPERISFLAGVSAFRAGETAEARAALTRAAESEEFRAQAQSLLQKLDSG